MLGDVFEIGSDYGLKVNGKHKSIPFEKGVQVRVFRSGNMLQFVAPRCDVTLAFDGKCNLFVEVSRKYAGKMKGLCGDCNGIRDDFRTRSGEDVSHKHNKFNLIGDSYAVKDEERPCSPARPFNLKKVCKGKWRRKINNLDQCGSLKSSRGPFARCAGSGKVSIKDFFEDCKIDVCSNADNEENAQKARCKILEGVAESCAETGYPGIRWRHKLNCPIKCHANQHFSEKANPCPRTCENHFYGSKDPCYDLPEREACECNEGFIRDGALCVRPSQCKCIDICVDRLGSAKCSAWKRKGRCQKFPAEMNKICAITCRFCKDRRSDCEDQLRTWKCIQFRDQGKCTQEFYRAVCALTCNYEKCSCGKDKKIVGPCNEIERQQTITYIRHIRNSRGKCFKKVTQRTRVCNCPFRYWTNRGPCNICTGRIKVTIHFQKEVNGKCIRRTYHNYILCHRCYPNPRTTISCLHNVLLVKTTFFNKRVGCFRCVPSRRSISHSIKCHKSKKMGKCNRRTCIKTITYIKRRSVHCRCFKKVYHKSVVCCCRKKWKILRPYCCNGKIIHRKIKYHFTHGVCRPTVIDKVEKPRCQRPRKLRGHCQRYRHRKLYCIAEDQYYSSRVNRHCRCVTRLHRRYRTCCCKETERYTTCDKYMGIWETVTTFYKLTKKHGTFYCRKYVSKKSKKISFPTQYIRKEGKCLLNCIKTNVIFKRYREGCHIRKVVFRIESRICCCRPNKKVNVECLANYREVISVFKRVVAHFHCINVLVSKRRRIIQCPRSTIKRSPCIYPGHRRRVTRTLYVAVRCRCEKRKSFFYEHCLPCEYKVYKTHKGPCHVDRCLRNVISYVRDVDCKHKVKKCKQLCCCKDKPWSRTYCDQNSGIIYTINYWYEFNKETLTCPLKSKQTSRSVACPLIIKVTRGLCGADRKYYAKITDTAFALNKKKCRCKPVITIKYIICLCDSPTYSTWVCVNNQLVRTVLTQTLNLAANECTPSTSKQYKNILCRRPPPNKTVRLNRCKYEVYRYSYKVIDCKCVLQSTKETYRNCCLRPRRVEKKCVDDHINVTTITYYRVTSDRKKCVAVANAYPRNIVCIKYIKTFKTPCIRGRFFDVTIYYGVRKCHCVQIKVHRIPRICECIPNIPVVVTKCHGNKWVTTVTRLRLLDGKCIPYSTYIDRYITCQPSVSTRGPCNRRTGLVTVRTFYYIIANCKSIRKVRYHHVKCKCWARDRNVRPPCVADRRLVRIERYTEVNGRCQWIVILTEVEDCRCPRRTYIRKCFKNNLFRTEIIYNVLVEVHLKITVRRCSRRRIERFRGFFCNRSYKYTTPCRNFRQSIVSCSYHKVNCRCVQRCRIDCIRACHCRRKDYCETKCIHNVKYRICHKFTSRGKGCVRNGWKCHRFTYRRVIPIRCSPPFIPVICSACTIYEHHGLYKKCTRFYVVHHKCRCFIRSVHFKVLCRCRHKWTARPFCRRNHYVSITTFYVNIRGRCYPRRSKHSRTIVCPRAFLITRNKKCSIEYYLTFFPKRHCHCIRRKIRKSNSKCCYKENIQRFCKHGRWVFIRTKYVRWSTHIKLFHQLHNSPTVSHCQRIRSTWTHHITCRRNYVLSWCNVNTGRLKIVTHKFYVRNCLCREKVIKREESCRKCPKLIIKKSSCHLTHSGIGYIDVTTTYYKIMRDNRCKKFVRHRKEVCRCPKSHVMKYCKHGLMVTSTITYSLHSKPPCRMNVHTKSYTIFCYNHGRPNPWVLVKVKRCKRPGQYTIGYYTRWVFIRSKCRCHKESKIVKLRKCCRLCTSIKKCIRNFKVRIQICYHSRGLRCISWKKQIVIPIRCPRPIKRPIGRCIRGIQPYELTTFRPVRCHCIRKSRRFNLRCECFPTKVKICAGKRWKVIITTFILVRGVCIPKRSTTFEHIYCAQIITYKDLRINRCSFWRYFYNLVPKHCKCVKHFLYKKKLHTSCCKKERITVTCKHNRIVVTTRHYFLLTHFHCLPRVSITRRHINCRHVVLRKVIKTGLCTVKIIYYTIVPRRCKCHRKKVREEFKEICCHHLKPHSKRVCEKTKGLIITTFYTYYLGCDGRCHTNLRVNTFKVHCNHLLCKLIIGPCIHNTKVVKLFCSRRKNCRCLPTLVRVGYECCIPKDFKRVAVGPCIGYFRKITYYALVLDKKVNICKRVIVRVQVEGPRVRRCRCPPRSVIRSCVNDVDIKVVTITYTLNKVQYTCVKTRTERIYPIIGCTKYIKQVRVLSQTCNPRTGYGTIIYAYIQAVKCQCKRTTQTKAVICICDVAYPPKIKVYCRNDDNVVTETSNADCSGNVVTYKTTSRSTRITNCDKVVVERGRCYDYREGNAISVYYVTKIKYFLSNCKCLQKVIERKRKHCRCRPNWVEETCHINRYIIKNHVYGIVHGVCRESISTIVRLIPCPTHPRVTRTLCRNNLYKIITRIFFHDHCKCRSRVLERTCNCHCPRVSVRHRCTRHYLINIITTHWRMVLCRCEKYVTTRVKVPICPKYVKETIGPCIRKGERGYRTIITRRAVKDKFSCQCKIEEFKRSQICSCTRRLKHRKYCYKNHIIVRETWKCVIDIRQNTSHWVRIYYSRIRVTVPKTVRTYVCNKRTGKETETIITFSVVHCKVKKHVEVNIYDCRCTKKWRLVKRGRCSHHRRCYRTDVYVREELRGRRCVKVKEFRRVKCCCPPKKVLHFCKHNRNYTVVIWFTLVHGCCIVHEKTTFTQRGCLKRLFIKRGRCHHGFRVIRTFGYVLRHCKCVLRLIHKSVCRCRCPKASVTYSCNKLRGHITKRVVSYRIVNCLCHRRVSTSWINIRCHKNTRFVSKCLPVKGRNYYVVTIIITTYHISSTCKCVRRRVSFVKICECIRNEKKRRWCHKAKHVINQRTDFTVFRRGRCVRKTHLHSFHVNCGSHHWSLLCDSGCIPHHPYGQRRLTYTRRIAVACHCKHQIKVKVCDCRCTGPSQRSACYGNRIRHVHYRYHLVRCKCVRTIRIVWERIHCRHCFPINERCREVSKGVFKEYTIYRRRFVMNCRCKTLYRRVGRICKCPKAYTIKRCLHDSNMWQHIRIWYELRWNMCRKQKEIITSCTPCNLTPDCHAVRHCRKRSKTQTYICIERHRENCECRERRVRHVARCQCKPKRVTRGRCNKRTCHRVIVTTKFNLIVTRYNQRRCVPSKKVRKERCCCRRKPIEHVKCIRNKLIRTRVSYFFNKRTKICDRTISTIDQTPDCLPARLVHEGRCNRRTCIKVVTITTKVRRHCHCVTSKRKESRECCCIRKDHSVRVCIRGNIFKTTKHTYRFLLGHCKTFTSELYVRARCPPKKVRYLRCKRRTLTQTKETTIYLLSNCLCIPTILVREVRCGCPRPTTTVRCLEKTGGIQTTRTWYHFNIILRKCYRFQHISVVKIYCDTRPKKICGICRISYLNGYYRSCITRYDQRVGCRCVHRSYRRFELCYCPRPIRYTVCNGVTKVTKVDYYVRQKSTDNVHNEVCVKKTKVIGQMLVVCPKSTLTKGLCIKGILVYTLRYYDIVNCGCVPRSKSYNRICICDRPRLINTVCVDNVRLEKTILRNNLACDSQAIPNCKCNPFPQKVVKIVICKKPNFRVTRCEGNKKKLISIHYEPINCRCKKVKYETTISCEEACYDMPHCDKIKKLGLCKVPIYYLFECQMTCGYCDRCPKDHVVKYIGHCKCIRIRGIKICVRKTLVKHYMIVHRRCISRTQIYHTLCDCHNKYPLHKCQYLKAHNRCKDHEVMKHCEYTCNPNCHIPCRGQIVHRRCIQRGIHKGKYEVVVVTFRLLGHKCLFTIRKRYEGRCPVCSRSQRKEVTKCIGNVRYVLTYYVQRIHGVCINKVSRAPYSCKRCCPSTVTKIGACHRNRRTVVTIFWANINHCCRKQKLINVYSCNRRCLGVKLVVSRCVLNKRLEFKIWYSGSNCSPHNAYDVVSCVPVPI